MSNTVTNSLTDLCETLSKALQKKGADQNCNPHVYAAAALPVAFSFILQDIENHGISPREAIQRQIDLL